jgi:hypothetical protein
MNFTGETLTVVTFPKNKTWQVRFSILLVQHLSKDKTWQVHFGQLIIQDVAVYLPGL